MTPVIIFAYNRKSHLEKLIKSLLLNAEASETDLIIFCDGQKIGTKDPKVEEVKNFINTIIGFKSVKKVFRDKNIGLANNIISGLDEVFSAFDRAIVLEDDLITTPGFLNYMNKALDYYADKNVFSVAGYTPRIQLPENYNFTTYPIMRNCSWGWATWKDRWQKVDFKVSDFSTFIADKKQRKKFNEAGSDLWAMLLKQQLGEINSWSIRFCYSGFKAKMPTMYPTKSFVINNGADGSGTHVGQTSKYDTEISFEKEDFNFCPSTEVDKKILKNFKTIYDCSLFRQVINYYKLKRYLKSCSSM
ncbi:MAG: glycosyltransferase family 2 protein [Bacteroidales bacterium]|nr:glycosyltransferase family 2 protein [Bacteroidales bacterium]